MTTVVDARELIYDRFVTNWGSTTDFWFGNEEADPSPGTAWLRVSVTHTDSQQQTIGAAPFRKFQRNGIITFQIFTPITGSNAEDIRTADGYVDTLRATWESVDFSDIWTRDAVHNEIGPDGDFYQTNLEVGFLYFQER